MRYISQAGCRRKKDDGGPFGGARQEIGRSAGAEQAARRTAAKRRAHVRALALLQQDEHDNAQRRYDLDRQKYR